MITGFLGYPDTFMRNPDAQLITVQIVCSMTSCNATGISVRAAMINGGCRF
jgi:hypothetical protein